jgi:hypothetical protein
MLLSFDCFFATRTSRHIEDASMVTPTSPNHEINEIAYQIEADIFGWLADALSFAPDASAKTEREPLRWEARPRRVQLWDLSERGL